MAVLPLWFKGLNPELVKYAEETLGETPELRQKKLAEFRELIKEKKDLNCRDDDEFLLAFLRPKKFEVPRAFKVLNNYYKLRLKYRGTFMGKLPSEVRTVGDRKAVVCMPYRLPPGFHITYMKIGNLDLKQSSADDFTAFLLVMGEMHLMCEASQICGAVNIFDLRDITIQHYTEFLTVSYISLILSVLQDSWPERIKAVHFLYEPMILRGLYKIVRPLFSTKLKNKLHFHGTDLDSFHKHIPPDYIPEELGGNLGPLDNTEFLSYFLSQESFIKKNNTYGIIENKSSD